MESGREISVDIAQDEWTAMVNEADIEDPALSVAALVALLSSASQGGIGHSFTCSVQVARELVPWCEAAAARWAARGFVAQGFVLDTDSGNSVFLKRP